MISANLTVLYNVIKLVEEKVARDFFEIENLQGSHISAFKFTKSMIDFMNEKFLEYLAFKKPEANIIIKDYDRNPKYNPNKKMNIYIDSICGILNFLHAVPYFATVITIKEINENNKEQLLCGVVNNYSTQELFFTEVGKGAFVNTKRMRVSQRSNLDNSIIAIKYDKEKQRFKKILDPLPTIKINNCSILDICNVASGKYDGAFIYDTVALDNDLGKIFIIEAGGIITEINNDIIVSNSLIHNILKELY